VGGAFLQVQLALELPVRRVGVDHMHQVPTRPREVGGVEAPGMVEECLLAAGSDRRSGREAVDGLDDHVGLFG
jgi:hypothetical protein